ncbi:Serine/threonine-protein kinase [Aulographum hederae CBS 113979]|uniref:non-specific serine/threonine protein kinase n=1 Tax=Aulographum hederae CBS 113979 TaxID=1176131 RepID=A0A6G1GR49_9PEZI|nr:Serine/threonine-protein kinase [Aulographum hederae CBS 113979]
MAPPKSPWKKTTTNGSDEAAAQSAEAELQWKQPITDYVQEQNDEISALEAIYMEDFEEIEVKGAWSKSTDKSFRLRIRSSEDPQTSVLLSVKFTATYPKTPPLLELTGTEYLRNKSRELMNDAIKNKPRDNLGQVMIYELATDLQDILEEDVQFREKEGTLPSLEEEREVHEAQAKRRAEEEAEVERLRQEEQAAEDARSLRMMVENERTRQKEQKKKNRPSFGATLSPSSDMMRRSPTAIWFEQPIHLYEGGTGVVIGGVNTAAQLARGPLTQVLLVTPMAEQDTTGLLVVKKLAISSKHTNGSSSTHHTLLKQMVQDLERDLEKLKNLRLPTLISVFDFKITEQGDGWDIAVLTQHANKGSLSDMLEITDTLPVDRFRSWAIDLLAALDFYYKNGVVHKRIHANNILISRSSTSNTTTIKLGDGCFQERLYDLRQLGSSTAKTFPFCPSNWGAPELSIDKDKRKTSKTDVWELGVVFLQMLFGLGVMEKYESPLNVPEALQLSSSLEDMLRRLFKSDPKKRPTAFDLRPEEFLRSEGPILSRPESTLLSRRSSTSFSLAVDRRLRRESTNGMEGGFSRYASDWVQMERLGKGGYGEVVKARNKLDGRLYAIKKIKQSSAAALSGVLSEVMLLSQLNSPWVVRYYAAWPEEDLVNRSETDEDTSYFTDQDSGASPDTRPTMDFAQSTGGLDFMSSSGYPRIEFGNDSSDEDFESDGIEFDDEDESPKQSAEQSGQPLQLKKTSSRSRPIKSTLYIQMEYCERRTLRDLIQKDLHDKPEEGWRLFRQVLEGLVHIHSNGIIHRDLKPDNVFIDASNNPRIGDFGLATSGQYQFSDKPAHGSNVDGADMTRSIGTTFYVAPELRSEASGSYNDKVDMYSLGIIFFEMCYPLKSFMERAEVLLKIREKDHTLPAAFQSVDKALQGEIVASLVKHRPSERPSSAELLRSGKVPVQVEDETILQALRGLSDTNSPFHHQMMSALFSQSLNHQVKEYTWDIAGSGVAMQPNDLVLQSAVKEKLCSIFKRHGALETQRQLLFPRSDHYNNKAVVQLLDASGTLIQLPYDLTLPYARTLARSAPATDKTFAFGEIYRDSKTGGAPRSSGEADFDILSFGPGDLEMKEAEVIKVMDEIVEEFPSLRSAQMCFHLNHSSLLELIMEYCRVAVPQRPAVKEILSKLNIQAWTWQKVRNELRSPTVGVSSTSLDDMTRFDFRDTPEKAFTKIKAIFEGTDYLERARPAFLHLQKVLEYMKRFNIRRKVFVCPLSSWHENFYTGGILFQCLYDTKKRDVLAAGGRYDRLIAEHRPKVEDTSLSATSCHAVGMNLSWDRLVTSMARHQKSASKGSSFLKRTPEDESSSGPWAQRRCDVLVSSFDSATLRTIGAKIVAELWAQDVSAELAVDARSPEELLAHYRDDRHCWVVMIKHEAYGSGKPDLRVKSMWRKDEDADVRNVDVQSNNLMNWLRTEIRERDREEGREERFRLLSRIPSQQNEERKGVVQVLMSQHKGKKGNKWNVIEAAQSRARSLLQTYQAAPIAAIETRDDILDAIRTTRLSDPDSWRKIIQSAPLSERHYLGQVHDLLARYARQWRDGENEGGEECRVAFLYNFRSGACVVYDLGL